MIQRRENWPEIFAAYLHEVRGRPYDPVEHSCATFVLGAIRAITGDDPAAKLGITLPRSESEVARVLVAFGGVRGLAEAYFGVPAGPVLHARRGDIVVTGGDILIAGCEDRESLGVVETGGALCVTPQGLKHFPLGVCLGAWKVG